MLKNIFKFRSWRITPWCNITIFQKSRWSLGIVFDVETWNRDGTKVWSKNKEDMVYDWSTLLISIDLIFIYIEFEAPQK